MSDRRDDDALAWAGDDDPTLTPVGSPIADDELDDEPDATTDAGDAPAATGRTTSSATPASAASATPAPAASATPVSPSAAPAQTTTSAPPAPAAPVSAGAAPTTASPAAPPRRTVLDEAEDAEDRAAEKELAAAEAASRQLSSAALIGLGILGGVYLLYTIGWIVSFSRYQVPLTIDFSVVSYRITQTLAIAATPLWFVATLLLTQSRDIRFRFLWLVIGMLALVPWPFLMGV
jgi:hypothetical protein